MFYFHFVILLYFSISWEIFLEIGFPIHDFHRFHLLTWMYASVCVCYVRFIYLFFFHFSVITRFPVILDYCFFLSYFPVYSKKSMNISHTAIFCLFLQWRFRFWARFRLNSWFVKLRIAIAIPLIFKMKKIKCIAIYFHLFAVSFQFFVNSARIFLQKWHSTIHQYYFEVECLRVNVYSKVKRPSQAVPLKMAEWNDLICIFVMVS